MQHEVYSQTCTPFPSKPLAEDAGDCAQTREINSVVVGACMAIYESMRGVGINTEAAVPLCSFSATPTG